MAFDFPASPTEGQSFTPFGGPTYTFSAGAWRLTGSGGGGGSTAWADITGKPSTFPPTLPIAQSGVVGLVTDLASKLPIAGGTVTGLVNFDNGTGGDPKPFVTKAGVLSIFGQQLRFWADLSQEQDGDYDADMVSKANMYLVAGGGIQLLPSTNSYLPWNADGTIQPNGTTGRLRVASDLVANYIQSGGNYNGDWFKDLIIGRYNSASPWMIFDESKSGYVGIGYLFPKAEEIVNGIPRQLWQVGARLHVIDSAQTVALFEAPQDGSARIAFKDQATAVPPTVGSSGDDLLLRTHDLARARVTSNSFQPGVDNYHSLGAATMRWLNVNTNLVNLLHRTAPAAPVDGDVWSTPTGFFGRVSGGTRNMSIHVGTTAPPSPATGDLWVDTN